MTTYQMDDVTATTDSGGTFTHTFASPIDKVMVSGVEPFSGTPTIATCIAHQTGDKQVTVKVIKQDGTPLASHQVEVTLLGGNG
jgi:hypothetical protein